MHHPRHRAPASRPRLSIFTGSVVALATAGVLGPAAYADGRGIPHAIWQTGGPHQSVHPSPSHPDPKHPGPKHPGPKHPGPKHPGPKHPGPKHTTGNGTHDGEGPESPGSAATNGGKPLAGDIGLSLSQLTPTPEPLTAYEMPFPCGQAWTGSTHVGHTPSIRAVDWNAPGDFGSPVEAAAAGTVVTAVVGMNRPSYGQYVVIDHGNGESTLYGHLNSVLVTVGQHVDMGFQIGTLGTTGNSTGPHLHFEERLDGSVVDAWFNGAKFPMNSSATSQNCGGVETVPAPPPAIPLAGNLFGGPRAEMALFEPTSPAAFEVSRTRAAAKVIALGAAGDLPVLGDWDGDGRVTPGVRDPATRTFTLKVPGKDKTVKFGRPSDLPIAGSWDGQGPWEVGVRRAHSGTFKLRMADGSVKTVHLGDANDVPVAGDWNGDGVTDLGVYDGTTATYTLLTFVPGGTYNMVQIPFGTPGEPGVVPVVGDWDGNGTTDLGTWNPVSQAVYERQSFSPVVARAHVRRVELGR